MRVMSVTSSKLRAFDATVVVVPFWYFSMAFDTINSPSTVVRIVYSMATFVLFLVVDIYRSVYI